MTISSKNLVGRIIGITNVKKIFIIEDSGILSEYQNFNELLKAHPELLKAAIDAKSEQIKRHIGVAKDQIGDLEQDVKEMETFLTFLTKASGTGLYITKDDLQTVLDRILHNAIKHGEKVNINGKDFTYSVFNRNECALDDTWEPSLMLSYGNLYYRGNAETSYEGYYGDKVFYLTPWTTKTGLRECPKHE